jgi:Nucleotidyl transferase AbiEii toxin, Type IV TA system
VEFMDIKHIAESTRDRLRSAGRNQGVDTRHLEMRFVYERFLDRLTRSPHKDEFILRGGMLIVDLIGGFARPTEDMDAHISRTLTPEEALAFVKSVCATPPGCEDGLIFDPSQIKMQTIIEGRLPGLRVSFTARWVNASSSREVIPVRLDLAWEELPLAPVIREITPTLPRNFDAVVVPTYPWEQVLAEKLHALVRHGAGTTRMKDFYDLVMIARYAELDMSKASEAIYHTFEGWEASVPHTPEVFEKFYPPLGESYWQRFVASKQGVKGAPKTLEQAIAEISPLILPLTAALSRGEKLEGKWTPKEGWALTNSSTSMIKL